MPAKSRPVVDIAVKCACGAVSVHAAGPVYAMFMCACADCQRATGTGHSAVAMLRVEAVTIDGHVRSFAREADSGAVFTSTFCPACGTPIIGRSSRAEKVVMVPVGLLGGGDDWYRPNQLIFARSHREWDEIGASLARHDAYRDPLGRD